jgi:hypothetical protein
VHAVCVHFEEWLRSIFQIFEFIGMDLHQNISPRQQRPLYFSELLSG